MDLFPNHFPALMALYFGAVFVMAGVYAWVKGEAFLAWVMAFVLGSNLIVRSLLDLTGLTVPGWVSP